MNSSMSVDTYTPLWQHPSYSSSPGFQQKRNLHGVKISHQHKLADIPPALNKARPPSPSPYAKSSKVSDADCRLAPRANMGRDRNKRRRENIMTNCKVFNEVKKWI